MRDGLDHILVAANDLDRGCDTVEAATGVRPAFGGAHPGRGTCNALASLGDGLYLEVIAPDPAQPAEGDLVHRLKALETPALCWWAARCTDLGQVQTLLAGRGYEPGAIKQGHRLTGSGERVEWSALYLPVPQFGAATPFLIDWGAAAHHPSKTAPQVGRLIAFEIATPDLPSFESTLAGIPFGPTVTCSAAPAPAMTARIETADGRLVELRTPPDFPPVYPPRP